MYKLQIVIVFIPYIVAQDVYRSSEFCQNLQSQCLTTLRPRLLAYPMCGKRSERRRCLQAYQ